MKRLTALTLAGALSAVSMIASSPGRFEKPELLPPFDARVESALNMHHAKFRADIASQTDDYAFIFPIVGSVAGANGYYRSETTIINLRSISQDVTMWYFPVGGINNCSRQGVHYRLNANTWYYWNDVVAQAFGTAGIGSVVVFAYTPNGQPDPNGHIDGTSRIWVSSGNGSVSQAFPAVSLNVQPGLQACWGARQDASFRTNIGLFNYDVSSSTRTFDFYASGATGEYKTAVITLGPCSAALVPGPTGNFGLMEIGAQARDNQGLWYGFVSANDNISGDSWSAVMRVLP